MISIAIFINIHTGGFRKYYTCNSFFGLFNKKLKMKKSWIKKKKRKRKVFLYVNDAQAYYYDEYQIQINKKKRYIREYYENPLCSRKYLFSNNSNPNIQLINNIGSRSWLIWLVMQIGLVLFSRSMVRRLHHCLLNCLVALTPTAANKKEKSKEEKSSGNL